MKTTMMNYNEVLVKLWCIIHNLKAQKRTRHKRHEIGRILTKQIFCSVNSNSSLDIISHISVKHKRSIFVRFFLLVQILLYLFVFVFKKAIVLICASWMFYALVDTIPKCDWNQGLFVNAWRATDHDLMTP